MQELDVFRNIHSPAIEVVVQFCSSDKETSIDVQVHGICTIQTSIIVDNVAP